MTQNSSSAVRAPEGGLGTSSLGADDTADARHATRAQEPDRTRPTAQAATKRKARRGPSAPKPPRQKSHKKSQQSPGQRRIRIGSPDALLAVVPWLLEFEPSNSMVVVGTEPPRAEVRLTLRYDLPDPPDAEVAADIAAHAASVLAAQDINCAVAVGYGPAHLVTPVADALREHALQTGIVLTELLRVENNRYWSYLCEDPGCCLSEGVPFDVTGHPAAQALAAAGSARVLPSRAELAATVATVDGEVAEAMDRATRKAEEEVARLIARAARSGRQASIRRLIATAGVRAVCEAIKRYRRGSSVRPETAAWLTVVLRDLRVRDDAWARMLPEHRNAHLRLWTDLTRMARPGYVRAPASLLAFVAWQSGNGALANVALDRALTEDPYYSMARLLRQAVDSGAPPSLARLPMTPEEVAASYDELESDDGEDGSERTPVKVGEVAHTTADDRPGADGQDDEDDEDGEISELCEACDTPFRDG